MPRNGGGLCLAGSVVVVAKCPSPGESKTRLIPLTGTTGSAKLATALLADVLSGLSSFLLDQTNEFESSMAIDKILLYAPATAAGRQQMERILRKHNIPFQPEPGEEDDIEDSQHHHRRGFRLPRVRSPRSPRVQWDHNAWTLLPMSNQRIENDHNGSKGPALPLNMKGSFLGCLLSNALQRARQRQHLLMSSVRGFNHSHKSTPGPVIFVGMDAPELPIDELKHAFFHEAPNTARLCPAADGGYGMLSVPYAAPANAIFHNVRWSDPLTAISQLKALSDNNIPCTIGRLMHDIDEPEDVVGLVERLQLNEFRDSLTGVTSPAGTATGSYTVVDDVLLRGPHHVAAFQGNHQSYATGIPSAGSSHNLRRKRSGISKSVSFVTQPVSLPCLYSRQVLIELGLWASMEHRMANKKSSHHHKGNKSKRPDLTIRTRSTTDSQSQALQSSLPSMNDQSSREYSAADSEFPLKPITKATIAKTPKLVKSHVDDNVAAVQRRTFGRVSAAQNSFSTQHETTGTVTVTACNDNNTPTKGLRLRKKFEPSVDAQSTGVELKIPSRKPVPEATPASSRGYTLEEASETTDFEVVEVVIEDQGEYKYDDEIGSLCQDQSKEEFELMNQLTQSSTYTL